MKSWLKSKTVQSGIAAFAILLATTGYDIYKDKEISEAQVAAIIGGLVTLKGVIEGRALAEDDIFTPHILRGPNKKEVILQSLETPIDPTIEIQEESKSTGEFVLEENTQSNYQIKVETRSVIKSSLKDSSLLSELDYVKVEDGDLFDVFAYDKSELNHLKVQFKEEGIWYFFFVPHISLFNSKGEPVNLEDATDEKIVVPVKKTPINLPGYGTAYLEDAIYPNSNFYWKEVTKNGSRPLENKAQVDRAIAIAKLLDRIRKHFGSRPVTVTSWFRPYAVNRAVGGATNSQHLTAGAVDFFISGISEVDIYNYIRTWHNGGIAIKRGQFVHLDIRNGGSNPNNSTVGQVTWNY